MSTDAELDAVEKRLKTYVLERLADPGGSPALGEVRATLQKAIEEELRPFVEEAKGTLGSVQTELPGRIGQRLANVEEALDRLSHRLDRMDQLLEHFANSVGISVGARQAPKRRKPRQADWFLPILAGVATVALLFFLLTTLAPQLGITLDAGSRPEVTAQIPNARQQPERTDADRGWERVLADPARRDALCGQQRDCSYGSREGIDQARALQVAMETLREDFNCGAGPLAADGDIGRESLTAFRSVATCVSEAATDPRCADDTCRIPRQIDFDRLQPADQDEALHWALTILGNTQEPSRDAN